MIEITRVNYMYKDLPYMARIKNLKHNNTVNTLIQQYKNSVTIYGRAVV